MRKLYTNFIWALTGEPQRMLVENGRVVWRDTASNEEANETIDLNGRYMLPGFIDAHCHVLPTGLDLQKLALGHCSTPAEVLDAVRDRLAKVPEDKWLLAVHYDQTKFPGGEHLTLNDLDLISERVPILVRHVNGHASVANSAALKAAGVTEATPDPSGGAFRRDASGRLDGVLLETAHERVTHAAPEPTLEEMVDAILRASEKMHLLGITCASDMMTGRFDLLRELEAYRLAAELGCKVRTRLYLQWSPLFGPKAAERREVDALIDQLQADTCRVAGAKIFADGAIGSATAAIYGSYTGQPALGPILSRHARSAAATGPAGSQISGQLIYAPDRLKSMVRVAAEGGYQVAIHSIGDYATDLVMDAYEAVDNPSRHRIEHAMLLSNAQIERMAHLGCFCTMQPEFLMRFGHSYKRQLGPERTLSLNRSRSVVDASIPLSLSSDRPIVGGDPWDGIMTAVNRPDGFDPAESITREEAVLAYTREGARVNEDESMGELLPGQLADFQLYGKDPMSAERPKVFETVRS
jgi:predicted amidohydrolase YtcJ